MLIDVLIDMLEEGSRWFSLWPCRYENEQPFRKAVEEEISSLYKVIDDANLTRMDLENQIDCMKSDLRDLARNHEEVNFSTHSLTQAQTIF